MLPVRHISPYSARNSEVCFRPTRASRRSDTNSAKNLTDCLKTEELEKLSNSHFEMNPERAPGAGGEVGTGVTKSP